MNSVRENLRSSKKVRGQPQGLMGTDAPGKATGTESWAGSQLESPEAGGLHTELDFSKNWR